MRLSFIFANGLLLPLIIIACTTALPTATPAPTPTPTQTPDEMFCSNIRSAAANAGMVMERLSDHSRRAALSPSLLLDSDWQESATFIGLDMESAGYLLHQVEFSPRSQHLRPLVGDIASLFETVGAMYEQSVSSLSIAEVEQIGQPLEELGFLAEDLAHAVESICG
jgi:hypothetical protein